MDGYGQIYKIENMINNKVYIGLTKQEDVIKRRYGYNIEKYTHNEHLRNSIHKYGIENFTVSTICYANTYEELCELEKYYIKLYNATNPIYGYNIDPGGQGGQQSEEGKRKLSIASKKYWDTHPDEKEKRSLKYSGENNPLVKNGGHSEESKIKMSKIKKEQVKNGVINIYEMNKKSMTPEAKEKRKISRSKYWFVQYDSNMNELTRWHTLKDMYTYLCENGIETHYKSYASYKLQLTQNKVFIDDIYKDKGFYFRKILKDEYVNTEETNQN